MVYFPTFNFNFNEAIPFLFVLALYVLPLRLNLTIFPAPTTLPSVPTILTVNDFFEP